MRFVSVVARRGGGTIIQERIACTKFRAITIGFPQNWNSSARLPRAAGRHQVCRGQLASSPRPAREDVREEPRCPGQARDGVFLSLQTWLPAHLKLKPFTATLPPDRLCSSSLVLSSISPRYVSFASEVLRF